MSKRVLFVCLGNICRSPTGEAVLRQVAAAQNAELAIDSAGTIGAHAGEPADARMRQAASRRGYQLDSLARQVTRQDLRDHDLVIAMDRQNYNDLLNLAGGAGDRICMLSDFLDDLQDWPQDVPDPYYGGSDGFEYVLDMIEAACPQIINRLSRD
ncbi:low molecular weight protein-tyrosine-phosphatase [Roseimaritima ulvae]|uniref:Low molecular weight protein-tyrosine-phosphatase YfkJ n=1 Tax=Roseimaritima ulvae TaxID=980254 RepID=A0A5B9R587_9BACT|nr:low molecular weight protein-tyrosine-phosphatase [Roseimaritima ulvae]QEG41651.1 Low molecular weight protein-tyrosine-phosphatase YfkJ [Roseimaritima ulvae]